MLFNIRDPCERITYIIVRQRVSQRGCCSQVSACGFWLRACDFKVVEVIPPVEQHLRRSGMGERFGSRWSLAAPMRGSSVLSPGVITVTDKNQSGVTAVIFFLFFFLWPWLTTAWQDQHGLVFCKTLAQSFAQGQHNIHKSHRCML